MELTFFKLKRRKEDSISRKKREQLPKFIKRGKKKDDITEPKGN